MEKDRTKVNVVLVMLAQVAAVALNALVSVFGEEIVASGGLQRCLTGAMVLFVILASWGNFSLTVTLGNAPNLIGKYKRWLKAYDIGNFAMTISVLAIVYTKMHAVGVKNMPGGMSVFFMMSVLFICGVMTVALIEKYEREKVGGCER